MNDQLEEDGTSPLPGNGAEKRKKATLDDLAGLLKELNDRQVEAAKPRITRSKLSLAEKVRLVEELGESGYLAIPYE